MASRYDDGGFSGGSLVRPALRQLLADVEDGLVDVVVIYKLDRLTRSLADFVRLIDVFEASGVVFVSVTQSFDTRDSMGRLVLNVLLTFAQFERELIADRVRDKMAQMKRAGRWTGGAPPFGYDLVGKRLVVNEVEAAAVRAIFERYVELRSANAVTEEFRAGGLRAKEWTTRQGVTIGGGVATRGMVYAMLGSPVYVGEFHLRGETFKGQHEAIIDRGLWAEVQIVREGRRLKQPAARPQDHLLLGLLFDDIGRRMRIESGDRNRRRYRYYISDVNHRATRSGLKSLRAGADDIERLVQAGFTSFLRDRFALSAAIHAIGRRDRDTDRLLDRGPVSANLIERWDRRRLRHCWEAVIDRIEVSRDRIRVIVGCDALKALLEWNGAGLFRDRGAPTGGAHPIHVVELDATAVRSERTFRLHTDAPAAIGGTPSPKLVGLMRLARRVQEAVYENRDLTMVQIAERFGRKPAFVARVLRLNYLAPDIIAAIMDGRQPPGLDRRTLVYSSLPTDWAAQRTLLGFPARSDPSASDRHYWTFARNSQRTAPITPATKEPPTRTAAIAYSIAKASRLRFMTGRLPCRGPVGQASGPRTDAVSDQGLWRYRAIVLPFDPSCSQWSSSTPTELPGGAPVASSGQATDAGCRNTRWGLARPGALNSVSRAHGRSQWGRFDCCSDHAN